ncbi:MAG: cellulose synthase/poly-beta-1,6-N-acetylglucosamine synthase-like glycosyltransferase [Planctomycetota bacterium]|jgi:cellulose synthase/poly-beta-1,6-N-acetylglucosamine synthase-like glycosyltransferase
MSLQHIKLVDSRDFQENALVVTSAPPRRLLGQILCRKAGLSLEDLTQALAHQKNEDVQLGEILCAHGMISETDLLTALSEQFRAPVADFERHPPDGRLLNDFDAAECLKHGYLPWRRSNGHVLIATANPAGFDQVRAEIPDNVGPVSMAITTRTSLNLQTAKLWKSQLTEKAENLCPPDLSCRTWARPVGRPLILGFVIGLITLGIALPTAAIWVLFFWVMLNLLAMTGLRLTALGQQLKVWLNRRNYEGDVLVEPPPVDRLPRVSVIVPLYQEETVLPKLITRLTRLEYPKELLDICLVLEESDEKTLSAVHDIQLPPWMRIIKAPRSKLKTKPRAMNYALDFCWGEIIGIYDAEDAPEPDQIQRIVRHFQRVGPDVACIQAYLDYYNLNQNWLARCFTIEYAIWFRLVLQGVERMKLPVPLGGTSVFFRREALQKLGAWDAHNVTEDADLGMRLARFGYRCAFEPTTTYEEANCHTIPWVKQRSRWLKGYAMTWITHMRNPRALWRDLGPKGFLTFQVILLGTLSSFLLAPAIWSFWLISFGFTPGFAAMLPDVAWNILGVTFVGSEIILALLGVVATSGKNHRFLILWVPTMVFYWPLGTIAAYKAMYEVLFAPFYWDKTKHGISNTKM